MKNVRRRFTIPEDQLLLAEEYAKAAHRTLSELVVEALSQVRHRYPRKDEKRAQSRLSERLSILEARLNDGTFNHDIKPSPREERTGEINDDAIYLIRSNTTGEAKNPVVCEDKKKMAHPRRVSPRRGVSTHGALSCLAEQNPRGVATYGRGFEVDSIPLESCYYCGMPATAKEHVIPLSILKNMADVGTEEILCRRKHLVRACRECNNLLGATYQTTLLKRKAFLKTRLRERYHSVLKMKNWTDEELSEFAPTLRSHVETAIRLKSLTEWRLTW